MLFEAIEFATKAHSGQYRKTTKVPYIIHPLNVAKILIDHNCSEEVVVAGILHDIVEDTPVTFQQIRQNFGPQVARLVEAVSEPPKTEPWEARKQHSIETLQSAPLEALLIACADKLDNLRSIREDYAKLGESIWSRFSRSKEKQQWYFHSLAKLFTDRLQPEEDSTLAQEFHSEVQRIFGPQRIDKRR